MNRRSMRSLRYSWFCSLSKSDEYSYLSREKKVKRCACADGEGRDKIDEN
jgi:hypothetical protein